MFKHITFDFCAWDMAAIVFLVLSIILVVVQKKNHAKRLKGLK